MMLNSSNPYHIIALFFVFVTNLPVIFMHKTMDDKLRYIPNDDTYNNTSVDNAGIRI